MPPEQLVKEFFARLSEARVYVEQGLTDGIEETVKNILGQIELEDLPPTAKEEIRSYAESLLTIGDTPSAENAVSLDEFKEIDPIQFYNYGLALIEGQFWEEALKELKTAADLGVKPLKCFELCGDCAVKLKKWQLALAFYKRVHSDQNLGEDSGKAIEGKIEKCFRHLKVEDTAEPQPAKAVPKPSGKSPPADPPLVSPAPQTLQSPNGAQLKETPTAEEAQPAPADPRQLYNYGLTLIDGQFWREAIEQLSQAAEQGIEPLKCWQLCGDCAAKLQKWQQALGFYRRVYSDQTLGQDSINELKEKIALCAGKLKPRDTEAPHPAKTDPKLSKKSSPIVFPVPQTSQSPDGAQLEQTPPTEVQPATADPRQLYSYGLALVDGQFWREAMEQLSQAAEQGIEPLKCWQLCGDCAAKLQKWQQAFAFYQRVYADPNLGRDLKKSILAKIAKCSQEQKKEVAGGLAAARSTGLPEPPLSEVNNPSVLSLDSYFADPIIGRTLTSWTDAKGNPLSGAAHAYKVTDFLYIGSSSRIVELQDGHGRKFAGQALTERLKDAIPLEKLTAWTKSQISINSRYLARIYDLASLEGQFFIVREHLPLSLCDLLSEGSAPMPIPLAVRLGYLMLEALGDLHLHMAPDGQIRNVFHLDLRPSRILLGKDKPRLKIYNGGLWKEIEKAAPALADLRQLPLPHLAYRAPEQFRIYLARKRPPIFTDIYLFGALLYEMLTGVPAFKASSFEEYEIQHCEQYPTPPRVWRSEIPEELNELVMNCLATDPIKRFRSTTQISLAIEKSFPTAIGRSADGLYRKYLETLAI